MTKQDVNHVYEESVYQIRLRVAIALLACPGIDQITALSEADKFVQLLLKEDVQEVLHRYK